MFQSSIHVETKLKTFHFLILLPGFEPTTFGLVVNYTTANSNLAKIQTVCIVSFICLAYCVPNNSPSPPWHLQSRINQISGETFFLWKLLTAVSSLLIILFIIHAISYTATNSTTTWRCISMRSWVKFLFYLCDLLQEAVPKAGKMFFEISTQDDRVTCTDHNMIETNQSILW